MKLILDNFTMPNKYGNKVTICRQNHKHDSAKEALRCLELTLMQKAGVISDLVQQPKYILLKSFLWHGKKVRGIDYIADFLYYDKQKKKFIVEDTKGFKTAVYRLKKKLFLNIMKDGFGLVDDLDFIES